MKTLLAMMLTITTLSSMSAPAFADDRDNESLRHEVNAIVDRRAREARFQTKADAAKRSAEHAGALAIAAAAAAAVSGPAAPLVLLGSGFAGLVAASEFLRYSSAAGEAEQFRALAFLNEKSLVRQYGYDVAESLVRDAERGIEVGSNVKLRDLTKTETGRQTAARMDAYQLKAPSSVSAGVRR